MMTKDEITTEWLKFGGYNPVLFAAHIAAIAVSEEREACARICDEISETHWHAYKHGDSPSRADPHYQGLSMGADECAEVIRQRG